MDFFVRATATAAGGARSCATETAAPNSKRITMHKRTLARRRRDALHDLGHGLPLPSDDGPHRELRGNLPLVLHKDHKGLSKVLLRGARGVF